MFKNVMFFGLLAVSVAGCSAQYMVDQAFPGRSKHAFLTREGDTRMLYACEPGATEAETKTRAAAAHRYVEANIDAAAERLTDRIVDSEEALTLKEAIAMSRQLDAQMQLVIGNAEERFQCILFDSEDI